MRVLALGFDLFQRPKLDAAAKAAGAEITYARTPEEAAERAPSVDRVLADASASGALDALRAARDAAPDVRMVACYPHVQTTVADEVRALGGEPVPRGAFFGDLPRWLKGSGRSLAGNGSL